MKKKLKLKIRDNGGEKEQEDIIRPSQTIDLLRRIHEMEENLLDLQKQNEKLEQARAEAEESYRQYTDLYDFAPVGYFTLGHDGAVHRANLPGAKLLGVDGAQLVNQQSSVFVSEEFLPTFNAFFEKLISGTGREVCELKFLNGADKPLWVRIDATCFEGGEESRAVLMDISERKRAEQMLKEINLVLQTTLEREKELARTDPLTGINNRRRLFEMAEHEFEVAERYQQPLSVMMYDLDHFKKVNDTFDHSVGDLILQRVTQIVRDELRSADVIGRYGGEEFIVILPMTNAQQAFPLAERIRMNVEALGMETAKGVASVTLSIGIVELHTAASSDTVEDIFRRADKAMYAAKQAGRNRTEIR